MEIREMYDLTRLASGTQFRPKKEKVCFTLHDPNRADPRHFLSNFEKKKTQFLAILWVL